MSKQRQIAAPGESDEFRLPASPNGERLVLCSVFATRDSDTFGHVQKAGVSEASFTLPKHKLLFSAMASCFERSLEINPGNVFLELEKRGQVEIVGSITNWIDGFPGLHNVESFCAEITEAENKRRLWLLGRQMQERALSGDAADDIIGDTIAGMSQAHYTREKRGRKPSEILKRVGGAQQLINPLMSRGIMTPWPRLNEATNGLRPSKTWLIGALTGLGKTSICTQMVAHAIAQEQKRAIVFSREMDQEEILLYMACSRAGVDSNKLIAGLESWPERNAYLEAMEYFSTVADDLLEIDDETDTISGMQAVLQQAKNEGREFDVSVADYLQLFKPVGKFGSRAEEVNYLAYGAKGIARKFKIPVLVPSQLNTRRLLTHEKTGRKRRNQSFDAAMAQAYAPPTLGDFKDSGGLEQSTDVAIVLQYTDPTQEFSTIRLVDLYLLKQRGGPKGMIPFKFQSVTRSFEEIPRHTAPFLINKSDHRVSSQDEYE